MQEGESEELTDFKKQMLALMLALHERVERSEAVQDQQDKALQVSRINPGFSAWVLAEVQKLLLQDQVQSCP